MSKISFGIIALNAQPFLEYNLRNLYPFAHEILVVEGATRAAKSLSDESGHSLDGTLDLLKKFQEKEDPQKKLQIIQAESEGYSDGLWPEKDEMSQAYARRASGDWLWQVDSDEFYKNSDMRTIIDILERDRPDGIALPFIEFWGGFNSYTTGKWYIQGFKEVARIFRWGQGFEYKSHRPPTVLDASGKNLAEGNWLSGKEMKKLGIFMYHYSYVLPKQAVQKVGYYANVDWTEVFRDAANWEAQSYQKLAHPFFVGERGFPMFQWLEAFQGTHPKIIQKLIHDLNEGTLVEEQRDQADIERLLGSIWYRIATRMLRWILTPYWRLRSWLKGRRNV